MNTHSKLNNKLLDELSLLAGIVFVASCDSSPEYAF